MVAGYTRQAAANIQPGLRCNAEDVNAEYNQLANAFDNTNGHDHSGSVAGDAARIPLGSAVSGVLPVANGGTGTSSGSGGPFLPLSGGVISGGLQVTGGFTALNASFNGGGTALTVPSASASVGGTLTANALVSSTTVSFGPGLILSLQTNGSNPSWIYGASNGFKTNYAMEADFAGTAFYAPNGNFVGQAATLAQAGTATAVNVTNAGGPAAVLASNGGMTSTGFTTSPSEARFKTQIGDSPHGLAAIRGLAPKAYRRLDRVTGEAWEREELGLVAEEVAAVLPHAVVRLEGLAAVPAGDLAAVGEAAVAEAVLGLDYAAITVTLINAIKELTVEVEALRAKVGA